MHSTRAAFILHRPLLLLRKDQRLMQDIPEQGVGVWLTACIPLS
jgi:hypothetical protein